MKITWNFCFLFLFLLFGSWNLLKLLDYIHDSIYILHTWTIKWDRYAHTFMILVYMWFLCCCCCWWWWWWLLFCLMILISMILIVNIIIVSWFISSTNFLHLLRLFLISFSKHNRWQKKEIHEEQGKKWDLSIINNRPREREKNNRSSSQYIEQSRTTTKCFWNL